MPTVRQLKRYTIPRYPQGGYHLYRTPPLVQLAKTSTAAGLLLGLLQGCEKVGVSGPPPVLPDLMTEAEARQIITSVFEENGIELTPDVALEFQADGEDTTQTVIVDGYSLELRTGFEYGYRDDDGHFFPSLTHVMTDTTQHGPIFYQDDVEEDHESYLETQTQAFIDSLRAMGWI